MKYVVHTDPSTSQRPAKQGLAFVFAHSFAPYQLMTNTMRLLSSKIRHLSSMFLCVLMACTMVNRSGSAAELELRKLQNYAVTSIPAPHSQGYYSPYKTIDQAEGQPPFLIVLAEFDIRWNSQKKPNETVGAADTQTALPTSNPSQGHSDASSINASTTDNKTTKADPTPIQNEELTLTLEDIHIELDDGTRINPIGAITPDLRATFSTNPALQKFTARQQWQHTSLRVGALFIAPSEGQHTFVIGQDRFALRDISSNLPDPSDLLHIKVESSELQSHLDAAEPFQGRTIPDSTVRISNPNGKLLVINLSLQPISANINGGDERFEFWSQDFSLLADGHILSPIGQVDRHFSEASEQNITPDANTGFPGTRQELKLVFAVTNDFSGGKLLYMGREKNDITLTKLPPGQ